MASLIKKIPQSFRDRYRSQWREGILEAKTTYGKLKRQFMRPPLPKLKNGAINLHLGCGSVNHPSFINIDGLPDSHIHYVSAIDNLPRFRNNSVDLIYACHCLEHFPHFRISKILSEWFRVLRSDGILRLSVPDFDLLLKIYGENGNEMNNIIGSLMGSQDYKFNFHKTVFNRSSLEQVLKSTGFNQVQTWQPGSCELTTFDDCSVCQVLLNGHYYDVSLNLQAIK